MSRYYFHFRTETSLLPDTRGKECRDMPEAIVQGYLLILKALQEPASRKRLLNAAMYVTDNSGARLFSLPVSSVISVSEGGPASAEARKPAAVWQHLATYH